jgi:ABC-type glutathione transport system ATPase component
VLQASARSKTLSSRRRRAALAEAAQAQQAQPVADSIAVGSSDDVLLSVRGLRIAYPVAGGGIREVVHGVDLDVRRGEIHGLVGESGSGKSQIAFATLGILPKEALIMGGSVLLDGEDLLADEPKMRQARGRRIAYIPQEPMSNLDPSFTIGAQLLYGLRASRPMPKPEARRILVDLLVRVGITDPERVMRLYPHEISGGMAQRVLICGAVASDPDVIVADEPTTALDVTVQAEVLELLRELDHERGLAMILVTHNLGVVADLCDTVSVMKDGPYRRARRCRGAVQRPTRGLHAGAAGLVPTRRTAGGLIVATPAASASLTSGAPLLQVQDLVVRFPGRRGTSVTVIDGVSFDLAPGETLSLVGESGSGKTTIGRAILGLAPVSQGDVTFRGDTISNVSRARRRKLARDVQVVFQDPYSSLNPAMTVGDILVEPLSAAGVEGGRARIRDLLDSVGLPADASSRYPREFSGGQRQRVAIARALALNPAVIVCDEPTSALDVTTQARVLTLFKDLQKATGVAYPVHQP